MSSNISSVTEVSTSITAITSTLDSSTITFESTVTSSSVVITSIPPSTTFLPPTTSFSPTPEPTPTSSVFTSSSTLPVTDPTQSPSVVIVTSTLPPATQPSSSTTSSAQTSTTSGSSPSALSASGSGSSGGGGLNQGATIAIAVVIPLVVVAALIIFGIWFWRKRKARKSNEELRKNEMAEYGFNPNHDPSLAAAGVAGAAYAETASDAPEDNSGYRGWGATSSNRKASTTLGSASRNQGLASDTGSQPGGYQYSPATNPSDHYSGDPLVQGHPEHGDAAGAMGAGAAFGGGAAAAGGLARHRSGNNGDIRRGPSNASSAYSNGPPHSDVSDDVPGVPAHYYEQETPYNQYTNNGGPYGDGSYGGQNGQPVIRDVQARRNTRIERAPTMPQTQGGISQNF